MMCPIGYTTAISALVPGVSPGNTNFSNIPGTRSAYCFNGSKQGASLIPYKTTCFPALTYNFTPMTKFILTGYESFRREKDFTGTPITHITIKPTGNVVGEEFSSANFSFNIENNPSYKYQNIVITVTSYKFTTPFFDPDKQVDIIRFNYLDITLKYTFTPVGGVSEIIKRLVLTVANCSMKVKGIFCENIMECEYVPEDIAITDVIAVGADNGWTNAMNNCQTYINKGYVIVPANSGTPYSLAKNTNSPYDLNDKIGGPTIFLLVKYSKISILSDTPVLVDFFARNDNIRNMQSTYIDDKGKQVTKDMTGIITYGYNTDGSTSNISQGRGTISACVHRQKGWTLFVPMNKTSTFITSVGISATSGSGSNTLYAPSPYVDGQRILLNLFRCGNDLHHSCGSNSEYVYLWAAQMSKTAPYVPMTYWYWDITNILNCQFGQQNDKYILCIKDDYDITILQKTNFFNTFGVIKKSIDGVYYPQSLYNITGDVKWYLQDPAKNNTTLNVTINNILFGLHWVDNISNDIYLNITLPRSASCLNKIAQYAGSTSKSPPKHTDAPPQYSPPPTSPPRPPGTLLKYDFGPGLSVFPFFSSFKQGQPKSIFETNRDNYMKITVSNDVLDYPYKNISIVLENIRKYGSTDEFFDATLKIYYAEGVGAVQLKYTFVSKFSFVNNGFYFQLNNLASQVFCYKI